MNKKWYIYGAGGLGVETMDTLTLAMSHSDEKLFDCEFLVDKPKSDSCIGFPVVDFDDAVPGSRVTISTGEPNTRKKLYTKVNESSLQFASIISVNSSVSKLADVGEGTFIAVFCSIQATSIIGCNVSINTASIVGHEVLIGDNVFISSMVNLGGAVSVGAGSFIGMGALVREGVSIGKSSIVGMGSVVYNDIPDNVIALGNPARVVRRNEQKNVFGK